MYGLDSSGSGYGPVVASVVQILLQCDVTGINNNMFISNLVQQKIMGNNKINKIHYGKAPLVSIKSGEFIVRLSDLRLLKKNSAPCKYLSRDIYGRSYCYNSNHRHLVDDTL
jgi:hypothetical protein